MEMAVSPARQQPKHSISLIQVKFIEVILMHDEGKLQFSQLTAVHIAYVQKRGSSSML